MAVEKLVLAIDLGTSGMKVGLVTLHGRVLDWETEPVHLILTPDGGAEQSPEEWWQAFVSAAERLLKRNTDVGPNVIAVCCSTQGEGTVAVDRAGNALGNAILWMDMRGAPYLRRQIKGRIPLNGIGITNLVRFLRLTGGVPSMTGKDTAAHMLFIRDTMPELYAHTHKFLNVLDYMNLRLTEFSWLRLLQATVVKLSASTSMTAAILEDLFMGIPPFALQRTSVWQA